MGYDNILANVLDDLQAWWDYIHVIFVLIGFVLVVMAFVKYPNDRQHGSVSKVLATLIAGVCLINSGAFLDALAYSLFNQPSIGGLTYTAPSSNPASTYVTFSVYVVAIVGLIGVGRGILLLRAAAFEPHQVSRGLIHLFGGILCVNIVEVLRVLGATLGSDVSSLVVSLVG